MGDSYLYKGSGYAIDSAINAAYGTSENFGEPFIDFRYPSGNIGFPTDPTSANQLQKVAQKLNTGAKHIEVQGLGIAGGGGPMSHMEKIPKQFYKEINRLKQLTDVSLSFHGPLVEATGVSKQGWTEYDRVAAERQMKEVIHRSHELDAKGNIIVTFHSSNGLPEPETRVINEKGEQELKEFWVVNEDNGHFENVAPQANYLEKQENINPTELVKKKNEDLWFRELQHVNFNVHSGATIIKNAIARTSGDENAKDEENRLLKLYKEIGTEQGVNKLKEFKEFSPNVQDRLNELIHGDIYLREAYGGFQDLFNRAYKNALDKDNQDSKNKLEKFREDLMPKIEEIKKDPSKVRMLAEELIKGINVLRTIEPPKVLSTLRPWAIDKASTTFANVALDAYDSYKENAPIISIENPPAGSGLSTAEDLKDLVDESRSKFMHQAMEKFGWSESKAKEQAEKILGVTWDVGHINILRSKGYKSEDIVNQTKVAAPYVKHVHLSDNFGLEHSELPMGMGNVPTKQMLELIKGYNDKVKMIVETGDWFSQQGGLGMKNTPVMQTFSAFGSSAYSNNMAPYWNQVWDIPGGYWSGQGPINPQVHHSIYGSGFTNLPVELGGQMAGQSRASGAPIE